MLFRFIIWRKFHVCVSDCISEEAPKDNSENFLNEITNIYSVFAADWHFYRTRETAHFYSHHGHLNKGL